MGLIMLDLLDRQIEIEAADNGYVLRYSGSMTETDEDGYTSKEYVRNVEVFDNIRDVCARLHELDGVALDS